MNLSTDMNSLREFSLDWWILYPRDWDIIIHTFLQISNLYEIGLNNMNFSTDMNSLREFSFDWWILSLRDWDIIIHTFLQICNLYEIRLYNMLLSTDKNSLREFSLINNILTNLAIIYTFESNFRITICIDKSIHSCYFSSVG